jgi:acyl-CoA synthetase (AMP-forming)/AMP-acid ligase II
VFLPIDFLYASARRVPDKIAVEAPGAKLTYRQLVERVDALAAGLQGIDPMLQSRVGICANNTLDHLLALLATLAAGKVWVPLNPREVRAELDAKVAVTRPSVVIAGEDCLDQITRPNEAAFLVGIDGLARDGKRPERPSLTREATQAIKFTGGTTNRPKGVLQPYRAWIAGAVCMIHGFGLTEDDRVLLAAPMTHGTSCYIAPTLALGGTLVIGAPRARPADVLDAFAALDVSATFLPPTMIYMMMAEPGVRDRSYPKLSKLIYGAASMPPPKIREAESVFGPVLATNYGQTEAPQVITTLAPADFRDDANLASVGRASLLTRVAIMDKEGRILPPGEEGEIVVAGDLVMTGYLDMPEQTGETIIDGWLHTGDGGVVDERGFVFLKDRLRDVIITGGFNVYPSDVEAALVRHPKVHECVVFGLADEKWGEAVNVAVQLKGGAQATAEEIVAFAKQELGSVKAPKRVVFYDDLPRSAVGKVLRREVKAMEEKKAGGADAR